MMNHSHQCVFLGLVVICVILTNRVITAQEVGGSYTCNPPWSDGDKVNITFRIDRSKYPSKCGAGTTAGKVVFKTSPAANESYGANCTTTDIRPQGSCTFNPGTIGCGCINSNDNGFYVVEYNFIFGPDYHRFWEAEISCADSGTLAQLLSYTNNRNDCKPVAEGTSDVTSGQKDCKFCSCEAGCEGELIGCIFLIIVIIIIIVICTCCLMYCLCYATTSGWCCQAKVYKCCDCCLPLCGCGDCTQEEKRKRKLRKPPCPEGDPENHSDGDVGQSSRKTLAVHVATSATKQSRILPEPKKDISEAVSRAEVKSREEEVAGQGGRPLPTPSYAASEGTHTVILSTTPRQAQLAPINTSTMPSVERNSWAKPLPAIISSKD